MQTLIVSLLRFYLKTLALFAPKVAGREAYRFFSTPRKRAKVPSLVVEVMARAERFEVEAVGQRVAAYRWCSGEDGCSADDSGATKPRILLWHGWESRAARLAVWVDPLLAAGFEVVAFDAPAHGESTGRRSDPRAFTEAAWAVVERVGPVTACVGHSLGGFASLLAVGGGKLLGREGLAVDRLVVLAGAETGTDAMAMFCEVLGLGEGYLPLVLAGAAEAGGGPVADFDAHRLFADSQIPILWLHDPADPEVPYAGAERVARVSPAVTLEKVEGLGHHHIARNPKVVRRGLEFLEGLAGNSAAA